MSTLNLIAQLKTRTKEILALAGEDIDKEYFGAALLKYDEAIETVTQIRELAFVIGTAELVQSSNETISRLLQDKERLARVQILKTVGDTIRPEDMPLRRDMH